MKSNRITIGILVGVLVLIWGRIAFKIKEYVPEKREYFSGMMDSEARDKNSDTIVYTLKGEYKDPFLGEASKKRSKAIVRAKILPPKIIWPDLVYKGVIIRSGNKRTGIVVWGNKVCYLKEQEEKEHIQVKEIAEKYIVLEQKGEKKRIEIIKNQ